MEDRSTYPPKIQKSLFLTVKLTGNRAIAIKERHLPIDWFLIGLVKVKIKRFLPKHPKSDPHLVGYYKGVEKRG
jgi:hypothetical protein